jgi:hypothetical protein
MQLKQYEAWYATRRGALPGNRLLVDRAKSSP